MAPRAGLYHSAAIAAGNARRVLYIACGIEFAAARAVVAVHRAVQFEHVFAARRLMKPVDILRDDRLQLARTLERGEIEVRGVGLGVEGEHSVAVKFVELRRAAGEEGVRNYAFGREFIFLVVQAVLRAEIGYAAFGGHPRAAEEHYVVAAVYYALKFLNVRHDCPPVKFKPPQAEPAAAKFFSPQCPR